MLTAARIENGTTMKILFGKKYADPVVVNNRFGKLNDELVIREYTKMSASKFISAE